MVNTIRNGIVLDTETTGLGATDEILQLAIIDSDGNILLNEQYRPIHKKSWPDAQRVHGITPTDVADKPTILQCREYIQTIIDNAETIIIYNAAFDIGMLQKYGISIPVDATVVDVMEIFAEIYGDWDDYYCNYRWQKLSTCAEYYGYDWGTSEAHDALSDCRATLYCAKHMAVGGF